MSNHKLQSLMYLERKSQQEDLATEYCPGQQTFSHKDE